MKRTPCLFLLFCFFITHILKANDTVFIKEPRVPILIERKDNVLFYLKLDATKSEYLNEVVLQFGDAVDLSEIEFIKLYYSGTEATKNISKNNFYPAKYISSIVPKNTLIANPSYSILKSQKKVSKKEIALKGNQKLFQGINYFWISLQMKSRTSLHSKIRANIVSILIDQKPALIEIVSPKNIDHRVGIGVRHAGDDNSFAYRIPGIATSLQGTLLGVYDVRYNSGVDLQEYIDVGLSRSINQGKTWEKMRLPLSFGNFGELPKAQNGVGDPCILVDTKTNTIWIVAVWTHGMGNRRAWSNSQQGIEKNCTGQLVITKSIDDGKTWSKPINITQQIKDSSWFFLLQGPGSGITMRDGTLVFPIQFIDSTRLPHAGIMYSKNGGATWHFHNSARSNTTESQVAEIEPNILMLNMRDNRGGSRAVFITKDLGKTWEEHESSRKLLQEPVCMASLIFVKAENNILNQDILIFSNPNTTKGRNKMTIKISLDKGKTWLPEHQLLLDEEENWGYSCLTMIDKKTIGILYESSVAQIIFQAIKLKDIVQ